MPRFNEILKSRIFDLKMKGYLPSWSKKIKAKNHVTNSKKDHD